jgi:hypothetical protein
MELVWFDDHKGCTTGTRTTSTNGQFNVQAPNTVSTGFDKSVAFLIQPVGFTPRQTFSDLSQEKIGQIEVTSPYGTLWHEEHPTAYITSQPITTVLTFTVRVNDDSTTSSQYWYNWKWYRGFETYEDTQSGYGLGRVRRNFTNADRDNWKVTVDILDGGPQGNRVCGDMIYMAVRAK